MKISIRLLAIMLVFFIGGGTHEAFAAVVNAYEFAFGQDAYVVAPGATMAVPVYFQETVGSQDTSVLAPGGAGLITAAVQVVGDPLLPTQPAQVRSLSDIIPNPAFDVPAPSLSLNAAKLSLGALEGSTVVGEEYTNGVYRLLLGTFTFTAGDVPGEVTTIRATSFDPTFTNIVDGNMHALDGTPVGETRATIRVVPEPSTIVLATAALLAWAAWFSVAPLSGKSSS